jgi:hypothetical protein
MGSMRLPSSAEVVPNASGSAPAKATDPGASPPLTPSGAAAGRIFEINSQVLCYQQDSGFVCHNLLFAGVPVYVKTRSAYVNRESRPARSWCSRKTISKRVQIASQILNPLFIRHIPASFVAI